MNGRLDTLQAAILLEKLKILPDELRARQQTANAYDAALRDVVQIPHVIEQATSAWAQYTVRLPQEVNRAELIASLKEAGVPTMVYYVKPLHLQTAYRTYPTATGAGLPVCEALAHEVLSLPMSGYVEDVEKITTEFKRWI
jgi:dTDP-4-amino-4,6-dideoxygalactose transaminase